MSYNIFDGAPGTLPQVIEIVKNEAPDYLTLNEANTFALKNNKILKQFAKETNFPYFDIALSGEMDYHVAVFSIYPFRNVVKLQPLARACFIAEIDLPIGTISIASLHLTPFSEDLRHPEIDLILKAQELSNKRILMGDLNSLSPHDSYKDEMIKNFSDVQLRKFTTGGKLRFDAIEKIESTEYKDVAILKEKNKENTVPTLANIDPAHTTMRLDYFFVSDSLVANVKNYAVVKNNLSDKASDHYPIVVELSDI